MASFIDAGIRAWASFIDAGIRAWLWLGYLTYRWYIRAPYRAFARRYWRLIDASEPYAERFFDFCEEMVQALPAPWRTYEPPKPSPRFELDHSGRPLYTERLDPRIDIREAERNLADHRDALRNVADAQRAYRDAQRDAAHIVADAKREVQSAKRWLDAEAGLRVAVRDAQRECDAAGRECWEIPLTPPTEHCRYCEGYTKMCEMLLHCERHDFLYSTSIDRSNPNYRGTGSAH